MADAGAPTIVSTDDAPRPAGHYAQGIAAGRHVYVSGQLPIRADGSRVAAGDFEAQAAQALANVLAIVAAAGGSPRRLVRVTAYIVGIENWPRFDAVYARLLGDARPARTVVPVTELHHGFLVEVDAIAVLGDGGEPERASRTSSSSSAATC